MGIIRASKLGFDYFKYKEEGQEPEVYRAIDEVSLDIEPGQFIAVLGHNGSGKSTLAKHMNALLVPTEGTLWVDGIDTSSEEDLWKVRQKAGMVFQNPDNQLVATVVEEDVAFGPENLGLPREEIRRRVDEALETVGMTEYSRHAPHKLSGGQKQRVAIAGIIAMKPEIIIFDESTAMLDPKGRAEVIKIMERLNREEGITVINITHYMDEAARADRVVVINDGRLLIDGSAREVFSKVELLRSVGLEATQGTELLHSLREIGVEISGEGLTLEETVKTLENYLEDFKVNE